MNIHHKTHHLSVDGAVDKDGDLLIRTTSSGVFLTPAEQDELIQHLIEVRGAGRVQELLNGRYTGANRRNVYNGGEDIRCSIKQPWDSIGTV